MSTRSTNGRSSSSPIGSAQFGTSSGSDPTPCDEWTVRDLANHVTNENLWTVPLIKGEHHGRGR